MIHIARIEVQPFRCFCSIFRTRVSVILDRLNSWNVSLVGMSTFNFGRISIKSFSTFWPFEYKLIPISRWRKDISSLIGIRKCWKFVSLDLLPVPMSMCQRTLYFTSENVWIPLVVVQSSSITLNRRWLLCHCTMTEKFCWNLSRRRSLKEKGERTRNCEIARGTLGFGWVGILRAAFNKFAHFDALPLLRSWCWR